ncbi:MAG: FMN-binding protein [Spirochaetes bacterium]|nr:FMN-binding protein [Spirochaetota bacterium]
MKEMKDNLIIAIKLTIICSVAVILLTFVNILTKPKILENQKKAENAANQEIFVEGKQFNKVFFQKTEVDANKVYYFEVMDSNNNLIGYNVSSLGNGYGGEMKVMIAFDRNLRVINLKLLTNNETPGLGKNAEDSEYMIKFKDSNTEAYPFPKTKSMLPVEYQDSITGATLTFNGVTQAVVYAIELLENEIRG